MERTLLVSIKAPPPPLQIREAIIPFLIITRKLVKLCKEIQDYQKVLVDPHVTFHLNYYKISRIVVFQASRHSKKYLEWLRFPYMYFRTFEFHRVMWKFVKNCDTPNALGSCGKENAGLSQHGRIPNCNGRTPPWTGRRIAWLLVFWISLTAVLKFFKPA